MDSFLLDYIVIPILCLTSIFAFIRGIIKELVSTINWLAAVLISYFLTPYLSSYLSKYIKSSIISDLVSGVVLFILVMIAVSILTSKISFKLSRSIPDSVNQSLGFIFGFTKYYLICSLIFSFGMIFYVQYLISESEYKKLVLENRRIGPGWVINSYSYPFMKYGADLLSPVSKAIFKDVQKSKIIESRELNQTSDDISDILDDIDNKTEDANDLIYEKESQKNQYQKGYSDKDREKMNRLINIVVH